MVQQGFDHGGDAITDLWIYIPQTVDESVAVDRPDQLALDVAGLVETGGRAPFDFDMERQTPPGACQWGHDDEWKARPERIGRSDD